VLVALLVGFLIGGFVVWIGSLRRRREARQQARRIEMLEREMAGLRAGNTVLPPAHG
jgi:ABC-type transporter Mla subunit MlaD